MLCCVFFFFKQKTAYEIVDCDWSSDVCSSDLVSVKLTLSLALIKRVPLSPEPSVASKILPPFVKFRLVALSVTLPPVPVEPLFASAFI